MDEVRENTCKWTKSDFWVLFSTENEKLKSFSKQFYNKHVEIFKKSFLMNIYNQYKHSDQFYLF